MRSLALALASFALAGCSHTITEPVHSLPTMESASAEARPGLGTVFGERHESLVHEVPFDRDGAPFAQTTLYYDDEHGVSHMAARDQPGAPALVPVRPGLWVSIVDERARPLESVRTGERIYVVGRDGERWLLRVTNTTSARYELVASVDGLDVLDGDRASLEKRGYVVEPYATLLIDGYRTSDHEVAAFRFGSTADSYASCKGEDANIGVIGLAFFSERDDRTAREDEATRRLTAQPFSY